MLCRCELIIDVRLSWVVLLPYFNKINPEATVKRSALYECRSPLHFGTDILIGLCWVKEMVGDDGWIVTHHFIV